MRHQVYKRGIQKSVYGKPDIDIVQQHKHYQSDGNNKVYNEHPCMIPQKCKNTPYEQCESGKNNNYYTDFCHQ